MPVAGARALVEDALQSTLQFKYRTSHRDSRPLQISVPVGVNHLWGKFLKGAAWQWVHHPPSRRHPSCPRDSPSLRPPRTGILPPDKVSSAGSAQPSTGLTLSHPEHLGTRVRASGRRGCRGDSARFLPHLFTPFDPPRRRPLPGTPLGLSGLSPGDGRGWGPAMWHSCPFSGSVCLVL